MLRIIKRDCDWKLVKNICRATMGKEFTDKEPSSDFILRLVISEHSPIRLSRIMFVFVGIKSWIATHFVRHHEGVEKFISTQRTDRTGVDRDDLPQSFPVNAFLEANTQALINMSRVRLCTQASTETREQMEELKKAIGEIEPEISLCMVPNCVYRGGCPELQKCGRYSEFLEANGNIANIKERYLAWDVWNAR